MKVKKGDKVKVISGKDRGKTGKVLKVLPLKNAIVVEGVNMIRKHIKPGKVSKEGGIISMEKPIDASNVAIVDPKTNEPAKVGFKVIDGKKYRVNKKTGEVIDTKK